MLLVMMGRHPGLISHHVRKVLAAVTIASIALSGDMARDQALPARHPVCTATDRVA
jgi:hypothetical protein